MTFRTFARRKILLPLLLLLLVAVVATSAGAAQDAKLKGVPDRAYDPASVKADIASGRMKKVDTNAGKIRHTSGVWTGCEFVYLTTKVTDYRTDDGEAIRVSEDPDPMPPDKGSDKCAVRRNPTEAEFAAMRAIVDARNAPGRPDSFRPGYDKWAPSEIPPGAFKGTPGTPG